MIKEYLEAKEFANKNLGKSVKFHIDEVEEEQIGTIVGYVEQCVIIGLYNNNGHHSYTKNHPQIMLKTESPSSYWHLYIHEIVLFEKGEWICKDSDGWTFVIEDTVEPYNVRGNWFARNGGYAGMILFPRKEWWISLFMKKGTIKRIK